MTPGSRQRRSGGFTLIEILAVVLIIGLAMALFLPNFGASAGGRLRRQGERLAGALELARQSAVVTGRPHQVVIDLEQGSFHVEGWTASQDEELPLDAGAEGESLVDLSPPREASGDFEPIANRFGSREWLDSGYFFEGIDSAEGWQESGEALVIFEWDGTTDSAQIVISDPDNRSIDLDVAPMLETVRIREEVD